MMADDATIDEMIDRISRLCENIADSVQDCGSPEHLIRIASALECIFMAGHDDIDYEEDIENRRPDA